MSVQSVLLSIMSSLKANSSDYCDIETTDGKYTIVFKDGTMMSLIQYHGMLSTVSKATFENMIYHVSDEINNLMKNSGYRFACLFRKDLDAFSSLAKIENVQKETVDTIELALHDVIEEKIDLYRKSVYDEEVFFALFTDTKVLDAVEIDELKSEVKGIRPALRDAQNIFSTIKVLRAKHTAFVEKFINAFKGEDFYTSLELVNVLQALGTIRHQVQPDSSPKTWIPAIAAGSKMAKENGVDEYHTPIIFPSNNNLDDVSYLFPPDLPRQILSTSIDVLGAKENLPSGTIRVDGRLYTCLSMDIPPTSPTVFNALFDAFNQSGFTDNRGNVRSIPYCVMFMITGDGLAGTLIKRAFKDIVGRIPPATNANLRAAYNQLSYLKSNGHAIVGIQVSAMTWINDEGEASREKLKNRKTRLKYIMESWGGMTTIDNVGDPILAWRSNIIGLTTKHVGTKGAVAVPNALEMLPLTRPASPFTNGTILNKTLDGKLMKIEKFSPALNTWVMCIVGTPGSGKSVMMNNNLVETCMMPGLKRLPIITVIDKGISSSGFINTIRDALPNHKKHLAVIEKLRKDEDYAINPFDIKVGLTRPLQSEKTQMVAFLTALLTPAELTEPYEGTQGFVNFLVERMFDSIQEVGENAAPNVYQYEQNSDLDRYLIDNDIVKYNVQHNGLPNYYDPERVTYFALVRVLHQRGQSFPDNSVERERAWRARDLAHRLAMPLLGTLNNILTAPATVELYTNVISTGETMPRYAIRAIGEATAAYPCFAHYTKFDVDTARVVALDLQEVLDKNNRKQSSLFLQIARMIGVKKISLTKEDIDSDVIPELFKPYYRQQLENLNTDRKVLAIDEMHNAKGDKTLMELLEVDAREGRKWGLELIFASQNLSDFDFEEDNIKVRLLAYVTHLCVCSMPAAEDLDSFRRYFSSSKLIENDMAGIRLSEHGLTYLSFIKAKSKKYCSLMTLAVGNKLLWALTTDADDRLIRGFMDELTNDRSLSRAALAYYFGSGAKKRIGEMREQAKQNNRRLTNDQINSQTDNEVKLLADKALTAFKAEEARSRFYIE